MGTAVTSSNAIQTKLLWVAIVVLGAVALGIVALSRGETVNAAWLVIAAVCVYFIAYRFYALFIADRVLRVDPTRQTPAYWHNDGLDYVPTNRYVLFGHRFAAIAGAGPLVGPVLAGAWGYFLYQGVIDPMGGINTLWPLLGISNQMLAGIALILCTVVLFKMKRYAWVTIVPTAWLLVCTLTAGLEKVLSPVPAIGFVSHANDYVDATLAALFVAVVVAIAVFGVIAIRRALGNPKATAIEVGLASVA
jgi:carbon starvation protein CstA